MSVILNERNKHFTENI